MYKSGLLVLLVMGLILAACGRTPAPSTQAPQAAQPSPAATVAPTQVPATAAAAPTAGQPVSPLATPPASPLATPVGAKGGQLTVMTHDSFSVSEDVVAQFEAQCRCKVTFLKSGDAGLALNKAILSKDHPLADVLYGVDNTFMGRALQADIFEPYASPDLAQIPADLKIDGSNRLLPVDFGYVTLNYDKQWFAQKKLPVPQSLRDLTQQAYRSLLVVENPATSSPGLAFLLSTVAAFPPGQDYDYVKYWKALRDNDVLVVDGWENAYNQQFSAGPGKGDRPLVVSYATSPAAEVYFANPQPSDSPTGNIFPDGSAFRQVEFAGILKNAARPDLARQWIDFMLGQKFQADIPLQMWVYPSRTGTPLPDVFTRFAQLPPKPQNVPPEQIEANRDAWLKAWTDTVLR